MTHTIHLLIAFDQTSLGLSLAQGHLRGSLSYRKVGCVASAAKGKVFISPITYPL